MTDISRVVSENRRAVWFIAGGLLVNAALYALVVYPLAQRVQSEQQQAGSATRELVAARRSFDSARGTVSGKQQADQELNTFYKDVLPQDFSGARRMLYQPLDQLARKSNLTIVTYRFKPDAENKGTLRKLTMTLNVSGDYDDVRRFIHALETAPEFRVLESVTVTQSAEGERELNVTADVATYYRDGAHGN